MKYTLIIIVNNRFKKASIFFFSIIQGNIRL